MSRRSLGGVLAAGLFFLTATGVGARIVDVKRLEVDLTNPKAAAEKAQWSDPKKLTVTKDGLGWDGKATDVREGWIQTKPLAIGLSWRVPSAALVRVSVRPPAKEIVSADGRKMLPAAGKVSVRYSPDLKHWSRWQALTPGEQPDYETNKPLCRYYETTLRVPDRDRGEYGKLLSEYSTLDVPWKSDEEAAVRWILGRDPDFFTKYLPFVGYVEIRFQGDFYGGWRLRSITVETSCMMGGLHAIPRDPAVYKDRNGPWRFKAAESDKPASSPSSKPGSSARDKKAEE